MTKPEYEWYNFDKENAQEMLEKEYTWSSSLSILKDNDVFEGDAYKSSSSWCFNGPGPPLTVIFMK